MPNKSILKLSALLIVTGITNSALADTVLNVQKFSVRFPPVDSITINCPSCLSIVSKNINNDKNKALSVYSFYIKPDNIEEGEMSISFNMHACIYKASIPFKLDTLGNFIFDYNALYELTLDPKSKYTCPSFPSIVVFKSGETLTIDSKHHAPV